VRIVRPGDSLWSIATGLAGPQASDADIARLVEGLWQLNHKQIATGDPDLLLVGTVLELP
jgi:Tfp pilus assembly protein FimV